MKWFVKIIFSFFLFFFLGLSDAYALENDVNIYFFHSKDCIHCQEENKVLKRIEKIYHNVHIHYFEIHDEENSSLLDEVRNIYHIKSKGVPVTVIGDTSYIGFQSEKSIPLFVKTIEYYSTYPYQNRIQQLLNPDNQLETFSEDEIPSLDSFISDSYELWGIKIEELDLSLIPIVISLFSIFNIWSLLSLFILLLLIKYNKNLIDKVWLVMFYFLFLLGFRFCHIFHDNSVILALLFFFLICSIKLGKKNFLYGIILFSSMGLFEYVFSLTFDRHLVILKRIASLNLLIGFDKIYYYGSYFLSIFFISMILITIFFKKKLDC